MKHLSLILSFFLLSAYGISDACSQIICNNLIYTPNPEPHLQFSTSHASETNFEYPIIEPRQGNAGNLSVTETGIHFFRKYGGLLAAAGSMAYGIVALNNPLLHKWDAGVSQYVGARVHRRYRADDYIQYVPAVAVYGLNLAGVPARHNLRDRTIVLASSYLITAGVVNILKHTVGVKRPDSDARNSFPSGHTATAFTGAHILFREYKGVSPWIGVSGYIVATATGALRVANNRHWVSDVIMGAGIGIAAAELGYILLPLIQKALGITPRETGLCFEPVTGYGYCGLGLSFVF